MKISYGDLTIIAENLGSLYEDGIAIGDGLELLNELPLSKNYKNSITYIRNDILLGKSLSEAFSKFDELYPGLFIGILKVGENSGQLGRTFNKLEMFYSKLGNIKKEIKNALIYPSFLIGTLILLGVFLAFVLIPSFYESYKNAGSEALFLTIFPFTPFLFKLSQNITSSFFIQFALAYSTFSILTSSLVFILLNENGNKISAVIIKIYNPLFSSFESFLTLSFTYSIGRKFLFINFFCI